MKNFSVLQKEEFISDSETSAVSSAEWGQKSGSGQSLTQQIKTFYNVSLR